MATQNPFGALGITVSVPVGAEEAVARATEALKKEGFGVLTRIDVAHTLKEKIGVDFRPYVILGACNPTLAHRALSETSAVGLLLPCNVVVEETERGSLISAMDPLAGLAAVGDGRLNPVAEEAKERLERVMASLGPIAA